MIGDFALTLLIVHFHERHTRGHNVNFGGGCPIEHLKCNRSYDTPLALAASDFPQCPVIFAQHCGPLEGNPKLGANGLKRNPAKYL
jgi:hypothetical protein